MANNAVLASGLIEQISEPMSRTRMKYKDTSGVEQLIEQTAPIADHHEALKKMSLLLVESGVIQNLNDLDGIGHRVVQGGASFQAPAMIDEYVMSEIERLIPLAPLHNPGHLSGMKVSVEQSPNVPQVAIFDTAFHSTLPKYAYMYALPYKYYEELRIRRYGFHGTSHRYIVKEAAKYLKQDINTLNAITLHLGNGASIAAIENGKSVDTSMGLTPLEGLIMGTRSGDIDPAILFYLARKRGLTLDELDRMLNKESGLKGICGSNDMREISRLAHEGNEQAQLARDMFNYRLKKYIGAYSAILGRVDCIIFTGGIGENDSEVRCESCSRLENFGIKIDTTRNTARTEGIRQISMDDSAVKVLVIPTNEELEIAVETMEMIEKHC